MAKKKSAPKKAEKSAEEVRHDKEREKQGYKRRERPPIEKWDTGMEVSGDLLEAPRKGSVGFLFDLIDEEGVQRTYGCPTMLQGLLKGIVPGTNVLIECTGKIPSKRGQDQWVFRVYEREGDDDGATSVPFD